ncbi:IclR family transcriptional regulator [Burkholderia cepacia]|uniref:IclR family transcriptional regulator n=1 Tax=Burkholderia cepacia TaxID=292 RepID=UPI00158A5F42|nr:IclR family transcriptional regulator [Burkholderia cepacia]
MTDASKEELSGKQVVARAASILEALEGQTSGLSLGDIAKATGLPKSTVQRLVGMLEVRQFVAAGATGIRLGPAITRLAASIHTDVVTIAAPAIEAASRRVRETIDFSVYRGTHVISIFQHASDRELRVVSPIGAAFPIYCTAHGKAILSTFTNDEIKTILRGELDSRNSRTITDIPTLLSEIESVRKTGLAFDFEEHEEGVCALGVSVDCATNERHAISIAAPTLRFERNLVELKAAILKCRIEIEAYFGRK